ncbi:hypothetical protein V6N13_033636 [Hibiscus sabdariffa]|uniref:Uncharacterized protein n=1 Tax=Hibiscus sabdariffa TaxID=183260 RepID=A0ABR2F9W4_9ROSI
MGKYVELLDAAVRIAARFHSHFPQTGRLYYHPPSLTPKSEGRRYCDHISTGGSVNSNKKNQLQDSHLNPKATFGAKDAMPLDSAQFIVYSVS